jgi:hypothetical protein
MINCEYVNSLDISPVFKFQAIYMDLGMLTDVFE